ncbi:MAG: hypothetical protein R6U62_05380 [Bacteroidales bacterium]
MKRFVILIALGMVSFIPCSQAQQSAALHKAEGFHHFTGTTAFQQAYTEAAPGDTIFLSGGMFAKPDTIVKTIYVFGAGHFPQFTAASNSTIVSGDIVLGTGADNTYFEGLYFTGGINFLEDQGVDDVMFRRCRIDGAVNFPGTLPAINPSNNTVFLECIFTSEGEFLAQNTTGLTLTSCVFSFSRFRNINHALLENSIALKANSYLIYLGHNNVVRNNVSKANPNFTSSNSGNIFSNNVFLFDASYTGNNNQYINNYNDVDPETFFVSQEGSIFQYDDDYHLQNPDLYTGTDGSPVGVYGGPYPFKEGSVPFIPHIFSKNISGSIDADGNIQVEIGVAAQEH